MSKNSKKTSKKKPSLNKKPLLVIDTNIIIGLTDIKKSSQLIDVLEDVRKKYQVAISEYTYYEIVRYGTRKVGFLIDALDLFKRIDVDRTVLAFAALYYYLGVGRKKGDKASGGDDGDSIIASTAYLNAGSILTMNHIHFSEPYFKEEMYWEIKWLGSKNRTEIQLAYLLKPDLKKTQNEMSKIELVKSRINKKKK